MDTGMNSMPNMSPPMPDNNSMNMMHMTFYWSKNAVVLFSGWPGDSLAMYILSLFFVFLLALVVEVLSAASATSIKIAAVNHLLRALALAIVHALRMGLAYMIMLAVMSFNLGIFIAAIVGHGVGFFFVKARGGDGSSPDSVPKV